MRKIRLVVWLLLPALLLMPLVAVAADDLSMEARLSSSTLKPGEETVLTVSLSGYTEEAAGNDGICGLQVDITGVDPEVLEVSSQASCIEDESAMANSVSYNPDIQRIRLVYVRMEGTLAAPCEDCLQVKLKLREDVTATGSITLPVTVKIQTQNRQITLEDVCEIRYDPQGRVISVDISWGELDYEYDPGTWNPETHRYDGAGWQDQGTGYITVKNTGELDAAAYFTYGAVQPEITGSFSGGERVALGAGQQETVYLHLEGKPVEDLDHQVIGRVTVRIGGE